MSRLTTGKPITTVLTCASRPQAQAAELQAALAAERKAREAVAAQLAAVARERDELRAALAATAVAPAPAAAPAAGIAAARLPAWGRTPVPLTPQHDGGDGEAASPLPLPWLGAPGSHLPGTASVAPAITSAGDVDGDGDAAATPACAAAADGVAITPATVKAALEAVGRGGMSAAALAKRLGAATAARRDALHKALESLVCEFDVARKGRHSASSDAVDLNDAETLFWVL